MSQPEPGRCGSRAAPASPQSLPVPREEGEGTQRGNDRRDTESPTMRQAAGRERVWASVWNLAVLGSGSCSSCEPACFLICNVGMRMLHPGCKPLWVPALVF